MDYNKGRFIPNINPLSIFTQEDARSPFEGELCVDENTNDISFWKKNKETNLWENISRTKEIQKYLDNYEDDKTFPAARAFIADGIIHRFYYNKLDLTCWLDDSVKNDEYKYYAIKSVRKINGYQRYITGEKPHDGFNYENALTDITKEANVVFELAPNIWYTVEFYDENKKYKASINYISYPSKSMPIELELKATGSKTVGSDMIRFMDTRVINVLAKFNQSKGYNEAYLYLNQSVDDLKASIVKRMADGHVCTMEYDISKLGFVIANESENEMTLKNLLDGISPEAENKIFKCWSLDGKTEASTEVLSSTIVPPNGSKKYDVYALMESVDGIKDRIQYVGFDKIDTSVEGQYDCSILFDYIKTNSVSKKFKVDTFIQTVVDKKDVVIEIENTSDKRTYTSVLIEPIGNKEYANIQDFELVRENGIDKIIISNDHFGFGRNAVKIIYTEIVDDPLVSTSNLTLSIPVKVTVKQDDYFDIDKFIPTGYISNPGRGLYYINLKYFAHFENGRIEDITDKVEVLQPVNKALFGVTQTVSVRVYVDHINKIYHEYTFTVLCADPALAGNNSRIIINGNNTPRILYYDGKRFSLGAFNASGNQVSVPLESLLTSQAMAFNGHSPTHIRVREVEDSTKLYTDIVDSVYNLNYINALIIPVYKSPEEDTTLGEVIDSTQIDGFDNYTFQYYSIDGGMNPVTSEDRNIVCPKNKLIKFINPADEEVFLSKVYTKNASIFSVSKDKPFLVEGYYKDNETGKYICTGGIIHYAQQQV